jgi:16S rRNA (cytosine967-C5)-methyltransferase
MNKFHRNIFLNLLLALERVFINKSRASKVLLNIIHINSKWGKRDREVIYDAFYSIIRWKKKYEYYLNEKISLNVKNDIIKLIGVWAILNNYKVNGQPELGNLNYEQIISNSKKKITENSILNSIPKWIDEIGLKELPNTWNKEIKSLNNKAKVSIRVNTLKISRDKLQEILLKRYSIETEKILKYPEALIFIKKKNILKNTLYNKGYFEVQDANSQLIAPYSLCEPKMNVIDACAGAGGKSLHLSTIMKNQGNIIAMDINPSKLKELKKRMIRNNIKIIKPTLIKKNENLKKYFSYADRVIIDAPCSGIGTLKRNPELKWKLKKDSFKKILKKQEKIINIYSKLVKPNGKLIYSTCSILPSENQKQIKKFLKTKNGDKFKLEDESFYSTINCNFDGFYSARLSKKNCG